MKSFIKIRSKEIKQKTIIIGRYLLVGLSAALIHGAILISLSKIIPLWISNPIAFLTASLTSYLGHALFTFRTETKGNYFARRWLIAQYIINLSISALLPILIRPFMPLNLLNIILILTPTLINAYIWLKAKIHSARRNKKIKITPLFHADDFGLTDATNNAIIDLKRKNKIDSASLIVNGCSVKSAIILWKEESQFPLCLHLCVTEGPAISKRKKIQNLTNIDGLLKITFFQLLMISLLPKNNSYRKKIKSELKCEINAQIKKYKDITQLQSIAVDGHQHVHLIPIVLEVIIELSRVYSINWIRTTSEPIPVGMSLRNWKRAIFEKGVLKWIILQILSNTAKPKIISAAFKTNASFAGILFTGFMAKEIILLAQKELGLTSLKTNQTPPIILTHPAYSLKTKERNNGIKCFHMSYVFLNSIWRQKELESLKNHSKIIYEEL